MNQQSEPLEAKTNHRLLVFIAFGFALLSVGGLAYQYFSTRQAGELTLSAANQFFKDGHYKRAEETYRQALQENNQLPAAFGGLANSAIQTKHFDEALLYINKAIALNPKFGGYYGTRGLIYDHLKKPTHAIINYEKALALYPDAAKPMGWLYRLLYKVEVAPPTIKDRLAYLKKQMKLPVAQRKLYNKTLDGTTRPVEH